MHPSSSLWWCIVLHSLSRSEPSLPPAQWMTCPLPHVQDMVQCVEVPPLVKHGGLGVDLKVAAPERTIETWEEGGRRQDHMAQLVWAVHRYSVYCPTWDKRGPVAGAKQCAVLVCRMRKAWQKLLPAQNGCGWDLRGDPSPAHHDMPHSASACP